MKPTTEIPFAEKRGSCYIDPMKEVKKLPQKITQCPILEALLEIRFTTAYPGEAVFGVLYNKLKEAYPGIKVIKLPILELPETVRSADPSFTYNAHYRLQINEYILSIGPRVLAFSSTSPYRGWMRWSGFIHEILGMIKEDGIFDIFERIGLRYINFFEYKIMDKINVNVSICDNALRDGSISFRTELSDGGFMKVLHIGNLINLAINGKNKNGSVIEIDCVKELNLQSGAFFDQCRSIFEEAHDVEKRMFFSLLTDSFLDQLEPQYQEGS